MSAGLQLNNLTVHYGHKRVVDDVTLAVAPGQTLGLAGESGSGKSTVAMSVLRLLPGTARVDGEVLLDGEDVRTMSWGRLRAVRWASASIVFQGAMHSLNPVRRVGEQIAEPMRLHGTEGSVAALLEQVELPRDKARAYPHELSGGQKQRVMIAMALACRPRLVIADEPTTALDVIVQAQVLAVLTRLVAEQDLGLLMISHDLSVLAATCDELAVMHQGRLVERGRARQVVADPRHPHTAALTAAFPVIGDPAHRWAEPAVPAEPLLRVRDLTVDYGRTRAVDGVDLEVGRGEIVALVGQSGSGKTTLARAIMGLRRPSSGRVIFDGAEVPRSGRALKAFRRQVQLVLQDPASALNPRHTVFDAVAEGLRVHGLRGDEEALVTAAVERAELRPANLYLEALPHELSGGQQQRVVIAGALVLGPRLLVADEPVASLDASVRGEVVALLLRLRRELGLASLLITHDLGLAWQIADRVAVMHQGKIVEQGSVEQVLLTPSHDYTRALVRAVPALGPGV
ncbi:peptide/nickel transport system ATP-binding protein/peptide/nickel transport system ATP-binding protein [Lentzea xinjiangensis]|uniref:Peptide/nickel transport system ATP-binding protein/peptide/nickel transport system ATP-binding protein n=1 Tax=Lentzea xinjiangensis TaxID=402600 RepID=A0A1H9KZ57_9PSEU|nr:ABC transporter ATP-binding protein [Lentzea xinjiangensis]SER04185.1 peptide/nickel transport system ATP-binding protein/peptide/nickel transport system ATP-binding protein [Lentzea xinjiangensis]